MRLTSLCNFNLPNGSGKGSSFQEEPGVDAWELTAPWGSKAAAASGSGYS